MGTSMIIVIAILIAIALSSLLMFFYFTLRAKSEIEKLAQSGSRCKCDNENCKCDESEGCTCGEECKCNREKQEEVVAESTEENVEVLRYDETTATRKILIEILTKAGVTGISRLKKAELAAKAREMALEYPEILPETTEE